MTTTTEEEAPVAAPATEDVFGTPPDRTYGTDDGRTPYVRNHRYRLFDPGTNRAVTVTRVSTFAKAIADMRGLNLWQQRMIVHGIGQRPDLYALAVTTPLDDTQTLQSVASDAQQAAKARAGANMGTAMHNLTESVDRGQDISAVPADWQARARAYRQALDDHGFDIVPDMIERYVYVKDFGGLCGRFDRLLRRRSDGMLVVGDVKSSANIGYSWGEIAIQLALYARASHFWDKARDEWVPMPPVDHQRAVVMHTELDAGTTTIYPAVDIAEGWYGAQLCASVRDWRSRGKTLCGPPAQAGGPTPAERLERALSVAELSAVWAELHPRGEWTPELQALGMAAQARIRGRT
jgi:hypothetical protein